MGYYLGIDIGATHTRVCIATEDTRILETVTAHTPGKDEADTVETTLKTLLTRLQQTTSASWTELEAVGVGTIGPIAPDPDTVITPAKLSSDPIPIERVLQNQVPTDEIYVENDTTCGALATRAGGDDENMVYLTLSTGIGAGVVVDGTVLTGNVGEVGHLIVDPDGGLPCGCGGAGHWEAYCGGENIPRYARALAETESLSTAVPLADHSLTSEDVFAYGTDDDLVRRLVSRLADWNLIGLTNLIHAYAPNRVVVGGAVATQNPGQIIEPLRQRITETTITAPPTIELTALGDAVVLHGAVALAHARGMSRDNHA